MKNPHVLLTILITLFFSCRQAPISQYVYQQPDQISDGLQVGTLEETGIDQSLIGQAVERIESGKYKEIHSLLIYKNGRLVVEEYFKGHKYQWDGPAHHGELVQWDPSMLHHIQSVTKSITSACVGIAIDKGYIESVHQSIFDFLPDHQHLNTDGKNQISIEHLLTMTSGLEGNEWTARYSNISNPIVALWFPPCDDPLTCILEKPLLYSPGSHYSYFGGHQILLGEIIRNATKMDIDSFSRKYLFDPLGIDSFDWAVRFPNGVIEAAGGLKLTPRAMVKIGATFLYKGVWGDNDLVPEAWVESSAVPYGPNLKINVPGQSSGKQGYSYSWWTNTWSVGGKEVATFHAGGWGGQDIIVIPQLNSVVVFTGGTYTSVTKQWKVFQKFLIPAIVSVN